MSSVLSYIKRTLFLFVVLFGSYNAHSQAVFVSNCSPYPNYTITINAQVVGMQIKNAGTWGCNTDVIIAYTLSVTGGIPNGGWCGGGGSGGSLDNAILSISCSGGSFGVQIPRVPGSGTVTSGNNQGYNAVPNCAGVNYAAYCSGSSINASVSGPGLSYSTKIVSPANPLPIELLSFTSNKQSSDILLNWSTATETNNDYFTLEKSTDAITWEIIDIQKGAGNSHTTKKYNYLDKQPYNGISYYRLKQTDFNTEYKYSPIITVDFLNYKNANISIYPNPVNNIVNIIGITNPKEINLTDQLGQKIMIAVTDQENIQLDISHINEGVYYLTITSETETVTNKLIIKR